MAKETTPHETGAWQFNWFWKIINNELLTNIKYKKYGENSYK